MRKKPDLHIVTEDENDEEDLPPLEVVVEPSARGIPEPPTKLTKELRRVWDQFAKLLDDSGVLTVSDGHALLRIVQTWQELQDCAAAVRKYGRVYETTNERGDTLLKANPAVSMSSAADRRLRAYLLDFGITPNGRRRIKPQGKQDPSNPLAEFLSG